MIYVFMGPSASGKTTLAKSTGLKKIVTTTTRQPRPGEVDGVDYHFITLEQFEDGIKNNIFVEYTSYAKNFYGLQIKDLFDAFKSDDDYYYVADKVGVDYMLNTFRDITKLIFVCAYRDTLQRRMKDRGDSEESISKRLSTYKDEIDYISKADITLFNDDGELEKNINSLNEFINKYT